MNVRSQQNIIDRNHDDDIKMTDISEKPWQVVSVDFGEQYPDGHYN